MTSIHGYYTDGWNYPTYITSLTFTSNRKVYGPFGNYDNEGRKYFTIQVSGSKIVGFHGRSDKMFDLIRAIGAYLKPLVHIQQNSGSMSTAPVAHIGYPAANNHPPLPPAPPYYGNYCDPNHPPQAAPPAPAPTPYPYSNFYAPHDPPPPPPSYNNEYYHYQLEPPPVVLGRPNKVPKKQGRS